MMRIRLFVVITALTTLLSACSTGPSGARTAIRVGALYPLTGSQGPGGIQEYRGVQTAVRMVDAEGGVNGQQIQLVPYDVPTPDAAEPAIADLHSQGIRFVLGTYGSTISNPAAVAASNEGMLYWETGAVGLMSSQAQGSLVFRVAPTGQTLGSSAISFVANQLSSKQGRDPNRLRFLVVHVNDVYGKAVADGAVRQIRSMHLPFAGSISYDPMSFSPAGLARRIASAKPDVLFVSAYLQDGVALWKQIVKQKVPLITGIGTSSSFCMPKFGQRLGPEAVGLFASDKPSAPSINGWGLQPAAGSLLYRADDAYLAAYGQHMQAAALAGFSGAWALFHYVMPGASALTPIGVGRAALSVSLPSGSLPNGSGLRFAPGGTPDAGSNLRAASVIWEWVGVDHEVVVWPPSLATHKIVDIPPA
jgi:branched-chain amino acid transport system substrate-binding protein